MSWRFLAVAVLALFLSIAGARDGRAGYASIVIDAGTGEVLHEVNADTLNYPASLTKMMTIYLAFDALKEGRVSFDKRIHVSEHAASQPPTKLGLHPGDTLTIHDAVMGLITKSANDAAAALAEELGGTEWSFARMMTEKAAQLGMSQTVFRNASGLPDLNQVSTARDMARLSQALIQNHPDLYALFSAQGFDYEGRYFENHNRFMGWYPGADGIKTGYIRASGFNLAASVKRDGRRLIAVVLGGKTARARDAHMGKLFDTAFAPQDGIAVASVQQAEPVGRYSYKPEPAPQLHRVAAARVSDRTAEIVAAKREAKSPAPAKGSWLIQVGVFSDRANAKRVAQEAAGLFPKLLSNAKVTVVTLNQSGKQLYRARLTGVSRSVAQDACKALERKKKGCIVLAADA